MWIVQGGGWTPPVSQRTARDAQRGALLALRARHGHLVDLLSRSVTKQCLILPPNICGPRKSAS
eukprot:5006624-Pyramimonas_sp.AAC.2